MFTYCVLLLHTEYAVRLLVLHRVRRGKGEQDSGIWGPTGRQNKTKIKTNRNQDLEAHLGCTEGREKIERRRINLCKRTEEKGRLGRKRRDALLV